MKKLLCLFVLMISASLLFAYDYREIIFGNDYERITECTNPVVIKKLTDDINSNNDIQDIERGQLFQRVFEEHYENGTIYRLLSSYVELTDDNLSQMIKNKIQLHQNVAFIKNNQTYLLSMDYIYVRNSGDGTVRSWNEDYYHGHSVISRSNKIIGLLEFSAATRLTDHFHDDSDNGYSWKTTEKNCEADFIYWNDILNDSYYQKSPWRNCFYLDKIRVNKIYINYSFPLIDSNRPFMYMIQNAFDGNSSTSYVEDTDDDSISVEIYSSTLKTGCAKLKIINGYAKNTGLYSNNNRIKKIVSAENPSLGAVLKDNMLEPQIIDWTDYRIDSAELYKGSKYNDTCIAELDFFKSDGEWIFGE